MGEKQSKLYNVSTNLKGMDLSYVSLIKEHDKIMIRKVVEECDDAFIMGITKRLDYENILEKMTKYAEFFIVKYCDNLAGYASMYANDKKSKQAFISMFGLKSMYQGMGLGRYLMDICCRTARENKMESILLEVSKENEKGCKFYEKYGYKKTIKETSQSYYMVYRL